MAVGADGEVAELFALRPERVSVEADERGWPIAYLYRVGENAARIASEAAAGRTAIVHVTSPHRLNDHYGLGSVGVAAGEGEIQYDATFGNTALPDIAERSTGGLGSDRGEAGAAVSGGQF